jgi:MFS family permease
VYYLENAYDWSTKEASSMLSLFFLFFTLSRLFVGPVTDRLGYTLSIMIFSAFSGICSLAAVLIGKEGAILFAIAGIGIAPIYPTVMALLSKKYAKGIGTALTFVVTLMGIASVIGNLAIGLIIDGISRVFSSGGNEIIGLQAGYIFIAAMALVCSCCTLFLYKMLRRRNELA